MSIFACKKDVGTSTGPPKVPPQTYSKKVEVPPPPLPPRVCTGSPKVPPRTYMYSKKVEVPPPPGPPKVMALSRAMEEEERAEQDKEDKEHSPPPPPPPSPPRTYSKKVEVPPPPLPPRGLSPGEYTAWVVEKFFKGAGSCNTYTISYVLSFLMQDIRKVCYPPPPPPHNPPLAHCGRHFSFNSLEVWRPRLDNVLFTKATM